MPTYTVTGTLPCLQPRTRWSNSTWKNILEGDVGPRPERGRVNLKLTHMKTALWGSPGWHPRPQPHKRIHCPHDLCTRIPEPPSPSMTVFGDGVFMEVIRLE